MYELIEQIRAIVVAITAIVITALAPTVNALFLLVIFAFVNAFVGYQANTITRHERFSLRKFWRAIVQLCFYMSLVVMMYLAFHLFSEAELALFAIKVVAWIAVWGYTVKILQNFLQVFPHTRGVKLLYNVLAVKFVGKLLRDWGLDINDEELQAIRDDGENTTERAEK